jgi:hypothetical protein
MGCYWLLADYGRSFVRPLVALALGTVLFHAAYGFALHPAGSSDIRRRATAAFTLANAVPFVGALTLDKDIKERLICGDQPADPKRAAELGVQPCLPIPPLRFQALVLLQTIVSAVCVFFAALALRNYFRVR